MLRMLFWNVLLAVRAVRHTYDPGRPFGRRIIDRLRRQISAPSREIGLSGAHETFSPDAANFHLDDASADEAALHTAIATLAPDERLAINLLKLKEMSLKEAALASGRSMSALKVAVHRAIKSLRRGLRQTSQTRDRNSETYRHLDRMRNAGEAAAPTARGGDALARLCGRCSCAYCRRTWRPDGSAGAPR
jgi:Sigma-70, region 4